MPTRKPLSLRGAIIVAAAFWLTISGAACGGQSAVSNVPPPGGGSPGGGGSVIVFFCDNSDPLCTPSTVFSVSSLRDLFISVVWMDYPAGNHLQTLKIFLPDGNLYQTFETTFEIVGSPTGSLTTVQSLPVAGSYITQRSLTGDWRVEVSLEGQLITGGVVTLSP